MKLTKPTKWTNKDIEQLERYIRSGLYLDEIADEMGRSYPSIDGICRAYGLVPKTRKVTHEKKKGLTEDAFNY